MAIQALPTPADGGLKSISDLYDLINGKTTTTSGGATTRTEQTSISQEGMNAALKNILEGTNGLAAISGGQRAAGGYGSSVNTQLTNDLLTRSAAQVAQSNSTKTITESKTPTVQQVGGVSVGGAAKTAGFLTALQSLSKLGLGDIFGKKKTDDTSGNGEQITDPAQINALQENLGAYNNPNYSGPLATAQSSDNGSGSNSGGIDFNSLLSLPDFTGFDQSSGDSGNGSSAPDTSFTDSGSSGNVSTDSGSGGGEENYPDYDSLVGGFADGGSIDPTKKKLSLLGESQYGDTTSSGSDPSLQNAATGGFSISSSNIGGVSNSLPTQTADPIDALSTVAGDGGNDSTPARSGDTPTGSIDISDIGLSNIGKGLGVAGALTGNSDLSSLGAIAGIAGSSNPALSAGVAIGNAMTKGGVGAALSLARDPSLTTVSDIVLGAMVPGYGPLNSVASMFGKTINPAQIALNAQAIAKPNQMMTEQQSIEAGQDKALASTNPVGGTTGVDTTTGASINLDPNATDILGNSVNVANTSTPLGFNSIDLTGGPTDISSSDSGNGGNSSGAGPGEGGSGVGGDTGGVGGYAGGGKIRGAGTTTSDSIPIKVSQGEYILPADVVSMIGVEKLDKMVDKYHVPAAVQKLQAYANGGVVRARSPTQEANDRGEIPQTPSQNFTENIFERRKAAAEAKIEADSRGEDGNAAFEKRMSGKK